MTEWIFVSRLTTHRLKGLLNAFYLCNVSGLVTIRNQNILCFVRIHKWSWSVPEKTPNVSDMKPSTERSSALEQIELQKAT